MPNGLTGDRWERLEKLFGEIADLPPEQREKFLDSQCGDDPKLRDEVLSLLDYDTGDEPVFVGALQSAAASLTADDAADGSMVGPYRIEKEIGRGGMSVVYLAVRDGEFRQRVAIKLIKRGMDTDAVLGRLRQERRILAGLEHPSIARLLDGGTTKTGRPWFAMEFVEGLPIHRFCEEHKLSPADRCWLIVKVCDAVAYAHRNLVIHRDLKPANIMVTPDGNPKLLDFGIAKLLDAEHNGEYDPLTRGGLRPLTPEYASPEQRLGGRVGITADIYSIGVILRELLTGRRPSEDALPRTAASDLDVIVGKALQEDPERRYQSAGQFAEDLRRYLAGLPIAARPDTLGYRLSKFMRRNRLGVAAAAATVLALTGGIVVSTWESHQAYLAQQAALRESARAKAERDRAVAAEQTANHERNRALAETRRANSEAETARAVTDFLRDDLLGQASPNAQAGPDLKVRTALDRAAQRLDGKFPGKPLVEAGVRDTIGESYNALGLYPEAQQQYQRVWTLRRGALGETHPDTIDAMISVAVLLRLQGKLDEAETLYNRILKIQLAQFGEKDPTTLLAMSNLAVVYSHQKRYAKAEALELKVLEIQKQVLGPEHLDTLRTMNNLGVEYTAEGKFEQAERIYSHILEVRRRVQGPLHPNTIFTLNNLAVTYARPDGDFAAAEKLYREALDLQRRTLGPDHPDTLLTMNNLGLLWSWQADKYPAAEEILKETAQTRARVLGATHRDTLESWVEVGTAEILQRKFPEAESTIRPVCAEYSEAKLDVWERYLCQAILGESLVGQKRFEEAEPLLLAGYDGMQARQASMTALSKRSLERTAQWVMRLYRDQGKPELAEKWSSAHNSR